MPEKVLLSSGTRPMDAETRQMVAIGAIAGVILAALVSLYGAVVLVSGFSGGGWHLPRGYAWLGRMITGKPVGSWFDGAPQPHPSTAAAVLVLAGALWLGLLILGAWCVSALRSRWRTYPGMATSRDVARVLGNGSHWRTRKGSSTARIIRPDLFEAPQQSAPVIETGR